MKNQDFWCKKKEVQVKMSKKLRLSFDWEYWYELMIYMHACTLVLDLKCVHMCVYFHWKNLKPWDVCCQDVVSKYHSKGPDILEKWLILGLVQGKVKVRMGIFSFQRGKKYPKLTSKGPKSNLTTFSWGKFGTLWELKRMINGIDLNYGI